ncbi:hypothetical protein EST38_g9568 [Candolleomyces aberdarensis]|uniref:Uncharacterized protein n=1 Tax=Candolleomyces aberdarensis TaxID=2316362 RepID=A0A4Q2DCV4_9AGAR|nr:hypothetical protein EST38_g9568 [Candolleomyces aberdarensis]
MPTSIHYMPAEVLTQIFGLAAHTSCSSAQTDEDDVLEPMPGITSHPNNALTPLILGQVCKRWREIIFSSPELWSTIYITNASTRQYALFDLWMKNSKATFSTNSLLQDDSSLLFAAPGPPMTIVFRDTHGYRSRYALAMIHMLRVASVHCRRWKSLSFIIRHKIYMELDMKELVSFLCHLPPTPQLQSLELSCKYHRSPHSWGWDGPSTDAFGDAVKALLGGGRAPKIRNLCLSDHDFSLQLKNAASAAFPLGNLTTLRLTGFELSGDYPDGRGDKLNRNARFLECLKLCKALRTLHVTLDNKTIGGISISQANVTPVPLPLVILPNLVDLTIGFEDEEIQADRLSKILRKLETPSITRLVLHMARSADLDTASRPSTAKTYNPWSGSFAPLMPPPPSPPPTKPRRPPQWTKKVFVALGKMLVRSNTNVDSFELKMDNPQTDSSGVGFGWGKKDVSQVTSDRADMDFYNTVLVPFLKHPSLWSVEELKVNVQGVDRGGMVIRLLDDLTIRHGLGTSNGLPHEVKVAVAHATLLPNLRRLHLLPCDQLTHNHSVSGSMANDTLAMIISRRKAGEAGLNVKITLVQLGFQSQRCLKKQKSLWDEQTESKLMGVDRRFYLLPARVTPIRDRRFFTYQWLEDGFDTEFEMD